MPTHTFRVLREGVGRRLMELAQLTYLRQVQHVDDVELLPLPLTTGDREPKLLLVGRLPSGETVVVETTVELFRQACREVGDEH